MTGEYKIGQLLRAYSSVVPAMDDCIVRVVEANCIGRATVEVLTGDYVGQVWVWGSRYLTPLSPIEHLIYESEL